MNKWLSSALLAVCCVSQVHAASISYNGYTLNTDTNIVTGFGLEWLQWDETIGQSINDTLASYSGNGWRIASNSEVADLYNNFFSFGLPFDSDENTRQLQDLLDTANSFGVANEFITLFGDTIKASGSVSGIGDRPEASSALFGYDNDNDTLYNETRVLDEFINLKSTLIDGYVVIYNDTRTATQELSDFGVALVRDVTLVPVPAAAWLFGSAIISLVGIRKSRKR